MYCIVMLHLGDLLCRQGNGFEEIGKVIWQESAEGKKRQKNHYFIPCFSLNTTIHHFREQYGNLA